MGGKKYESDPITAYWKWLMTLPLPFQWPWEDFSSRQKNRTQTHIMFPFIVTIEGNTDALQHFEEWCWVEFGPKNGPCKKTTCWENDKKINYDSNSIFSVMLDDHIEPTNSHDHNGQWTTVWALKTTYEDGFCDFCFKKAEDAVLFKFTFGFDN